MQRDRRTDRGGSDGGTGRRSFLRGAATTLLAAGALGTSVTNAAAAPDDIESVEKRIVTWDGKELATRIYLPETDEPAPAVLITHGYGSDKNSRIPADVGRLYADNGYVVLTYDSRGFGESDGEVGVDGPKEVKDAQALLDWLEDATQSDVGRNGTGRLVRRGSPQEAESRKSGKGKGKEKGKGKQKGEGKEEGEVGQPEPSIKVGMDGLSYAGGIQLNLAAVDDRLDAIVPRWAWNDLTYSLAPNGGVKAGWTTILQEFGFEGSRGVNSGDGQPDERDVRNGVDPRLYKFYAESAATNGFSPSARAFFKLRSPSTKGEGLAQNAPPSLLISGWNDTLFTCTETVRNHELLSASADSRMVFVRGGHSLEQQAPLEQGEIDRMALTWMHRHVGGQAPTLPKAWEAADDTRTADIPEVTYWRQDLEDDVAAGDAKTAFDTAAGLPDASTGPSRTLAEAANASSGTTDLAGGPAGGSNSEIAVQENDDYAPGTFADFDYPVDGETELLGIPEVSLTVTPLGRDPLVFAKVYHVRADGSEELIYNQSTPYEVAGAVGEAQEFTFDLAAIERTFADGDRLRVTLSTTDVAYFNSRSSAGVRIDNDASEVRLPVRGESGLAPAVTVTRTDDGDVFRGGATNQVDLAVDADRPVLVRDRTPKGWRVVGGDPHDRTAPPETAANYVAFDGSTTDATFTYFAKAPASATETDRATFGPVEYSLDGETWRPLPGTTEENVLVGASTSGTL